MVSSLTIEDILEDFVGNIISVRASKMLSPKNETLGLIILTRENIISLVNDGDVVYAKLLDNESNILLVKINIIIVNDKKYLRIDKKEVAQDNLKHNLD